MTETARQPRVIDRQQLPGGRIMHGMVYVGGGKGQEHPWQCPVRLLGATPEARAKYRAEIAAYIAERRAKEPRWLAPLRGKDLVAYGASDWADALLAAANEP